MYKTSKYSKEQNNSIRFNILWALSELAKFSGVDTNTMKNTAPYSMILSSITSQKITSELKKLIDSGMVVKGIVRGKTVKYMLRSTYEKLMSEGKISSKEFGYGDYRDLERPYVEEDEDDNEEYSNKVCSRIAKVNYNPEDKVDMW